MKITFIYIIWFKFFRQYFADPGTNHESNNSECDCLQCLPESSNQSQNTRKLRQRNGMCKRVEKQDLSLPSSSHPNSTEPLPGPSGISSNFSTTSPQTLDSSDSENDVVTTTNQRAQSDVLTAPELQLDCFSDTSSDSDNDVIAIVKLPRS